MEWIRRRLALRRIRQRERELSKAYTDLTQELRAKKIGKESIEWGNVEDLAAQLGECDEEREYIKYRALEQKATRLFISLPPRQAKETYENDEYWIGLPISDRWVLSPKGIRQVRTEIREEQKARRDHVLGWISPFIGIISALVGAVAGYILGRGAGAN